VLKDAAYGDIIEVTIKDGDKVLSVSKANATEALEIPITKQKLWSPESPFLYRMTVKLISNGNAVDQVESYFAMRKISKKRVVKDAAYGDIIEVTIKDGDKVLSVSKANATEALEIPITKQKLWSPESPFLYRMTVKLISNGNAVDQVESYFAMRKISKKRDEK